MKTLLQIWFSIAGTIVAFIPVGFYQLMRYLLTPEGFWQNIILFGIGVLLLSALQLMLLFGLVYWLYLVWTDF